MAALHESLEALAHAFISFGQVILVHNSIGIIVGIPTLVDVSCSLDADCFSLNFQTLLSHVHTGSAADSPENGLHDLPTLKKKRVKKVQ
jgi:hypothetical protein